MFVLHPSRTCRIHQGCLVQQQRVGRGLSQGQACSSSSALDSRRSSGSQDQGPNAEAADEELIRVLNTAHLWLPDEQSDEFGLDDVEAHLASRNQARVLDLGRRTAKSNKQSNTSGGAVSSLSAVDLLSGDVPSWVSELTEEGFDVWGREGELFLQRGTVQQKQQQVQGRSTSNNASAFASDPVAAEGSGVISPPSSIVEPAIMTPAQSLAQQKLEEAAAAIPDSNLAVRPEFDPVIWQNCIQQQQQQQQPAASTQQPTVAWYASDSSSSSSGDSQPTSQTSAVVPLQSASKSSKRLSRLSVHQHLLGYKHPEKLLSYIERCFPVWSRNGCWLLHQTRLGVVAAPTPCEAAAALKGVALAAKRAQFNSMQTQSLARDRRVLGLVECLRVTPPRTPPQQPASISRRLWAIAKDYWLQPGATAATAQQQLVTASRAAAAASQGSKINGSAAPLHHPDLSSSVGGCSNLGALLAQLQGTGLTMTRQQLAAAQSLMQSRHQDQLRHQAFVSAMWGMSVVGGPLFFQQEMDALCQVAAIGRWKLSSSELSDVLWSLANARHWTRLLPQLDAALIAAGGVRCCTAPELITALWSFATLAHTPVRLLEQLNSQGWAVKPVRDLPATQRSRNQAAGSRTKSQRHGNKQQEQQQQQQQPAAPGDQGCLCRLEELNDSQLTSVVWSLSCLEAVNTNLFKSVWVEACQRGMKLAADVRQLVRLHQAALAVQLEADFSPQNVHWDKGVADLLNAAAKAFKAQSGALQSKVHSSYQRSMASILAKQRVMHVLEDNTTGYSIDLSIPSLRIAIEADGPSHMSRNQVGKRGRVQLGATAMKRRHLQGLGWGVVNISYEDWDTLAGEEEKTNFLKQQIKAARAQLLAAKQS